MSTCSRCGAAFACGMTDTATDEPCWCAQLPVLSPSAYVAVDGAASSGTCFCPQCLRALLAAQPDT